MVSRARFPRSYDEQDENENFGKFKYDDDGEIKRQMRSCAGKGKIKWNETNIIINEKIFLCTIDHDFGIGFRNMGNFREKTKTKAQYFPHEKWGRGEYKEQDQEENLSVRSKGK